MIHFSAKSHVHRLVTVLSFVGEYPAHSLHLLGKERVMKELVHRLTTAQTFRNDETGEEHTCRLPNTELLCIIRGCNILKLNKLDYTKHPMAEKMTSVSIMDYQPQVSPAEFLQTCFDGKEVKEVPQSERGENKNQEPKKKGLYRSAQPPADF